MKTPRESQSCIYEGVIDHQRLEPVRHAFRYRLFMLYLDLAELPGLFGGRWLWSAERRAIAEFRRSDYPGPADQPLDESIRDLVEERLGARPRGSIRLLTHLRYFGYGFNPVSFFYCINEDGSGLDAVVADVRSTPWGERHAYVVDGRGASRVRTSLSKQLHVSPFMPMDLQHGFRFQVPGARLAVAIEDRRRGETVFAARLLMRRKEIGGAALARVLCRYPLMTAQVIAGIYLQALRLYIKGAPYFAPPGNAGPAGVVDSRHRIEEVRE